MEIRELKGRGLIKVKFIGIIILMMVVIILLFIIVFYNKFKGIIIKLVNDLLEILSKK